MSRSTLIYRLGLKTLILFALASIANGRSALRIISDRTFYLGGPGQPEWDVFSGRKKDGDKLELSFEAKRNDREFTFFIRQDDVKEEWTVELNGKKLGLLFQMEANLVHTLPIATGALRDGNNQLRISAKTADDILIHAIAIGDDTKTNLLESGIITIAVMDSHGKEPVPARITIVDSKGALAPINDFGSTNLASRPGVVYTATGQAATTLLPGDYTVYATRGSEYSVAQTHLAASSSRQDVALEIQRVVDTSGWIAADTHIHTLSLSKHGDALLRERVITLAGEGIELPVSTEHNLHADYLPAAKSLGLDKYFTIMPGNEVTTARGHFNIFPVALSAPPPSDKIIDWPELMKAIRATPNVQVVVLNHPKDTHSGFTPFSSTNLNLVTGRNLRGDFNFSFDAMELINSGAMRSDWVEPFRAWFALLNRGYKITGVGASDSHDVSRYIVGQGRTYIKGDDHDPGRLDIEKVCANLKAGHAVVSLGLFPRIQIKTARATAGPGDLMIAPEPDLEFTVQVDWPRQMSPTNESAQAKVQVFANGREVFSFSATGPHDKPHSFTKKIPRPAQDTYYVALFSASAATDSFWGLARPYQPTSTHWDPVLLGATNPIWVDADGDAQFTAPHQYAENLVAKFSDSSAQLIGALARYDWATAAQAAELLQQQGRDLHASGIQSALAKAPREVQAGFADYIQTLKSP